jgi:hypothetical protein
MSLGAESHQQHAGPKLTTYRTGIPNSATAIHFTHRSRRLMILTVSQTQKAAKVTPKIARARAMARFYPRRNPPNGGCI